MRIFTAGQDPSARRAATYRNRIVLFPFFAIVMVLAIMYLSPIHQALVISSGENTVLIFVMKDDENFGISFHDADNDADVENILSRNSDIIALNSMLVTGNDEYIPSRDDMPLAEYTKVQDGYLISGIDKEYVRLQFNIDYISDYRIAFRGKVYHLNDYASASVVTLRFQKVSLGRITRFDPNFKIIKD